MDSANSLASLLREGHRLQGRLDALQQEQKQIYHSVGIAKARIDKRDAVEEILDALEQRFHEKSLGLLESLLTAFLNDVLPRETAGEQKVSLELDTVRGLPALQVQVCQDALQEDALRGRGGSVANVLSAGLRFIAVARSSGLRGTLLGMRPFLILDEADCWLSPRRVADFGRVIQQLARDLGLQVLVISHHDSHLFSGFPVFLQRESGEDGFAKVRVQHPPLERKPLDLENVSYVPLTEIRLQNFLSHQDTTIPLVPGVTVLTGENDVGKSAVAQAFRAVAYNDAGDAMIRHGADSAVVTIRFLDGTAVQWERMRKGTPKVVYRRLQGDTVEQETPSAREIPDWVAKLLGIRLQDDLDVQIGDQKSPVFLLQETPAKRAQILDIGRESQYLRKMREQWKRQVEEDRRAIRVGEKRLQEMEVALDKLQEVPGLLDTLKGLEANFSVLAKRQEEIDRLDTLLRKAEQGKLHGQALQALPRSLPKAVNKEPLEKLRWALPQVQQAVRLQQIVRVEIPSVQSLPAFPAGMRESLQKIPEQIRQAKAAMQLRQRLASIVLPESLPDFARLQQCSPTLQRLSALAQVRTQMSVVVQRYNETHQEEREVQKELHSLEQQKKKLFGDLETCPVCGSPFVHAEHTKSEVA